MPSWKLIFNMAAFPDFLNTFEIKTEGIVAQNKIEQVRCLTQQMEDDSSLPADLSCH
jgi:hypothetical protein